MEAGEAALVLSCTWSRCVREGAASALRNSHPITVILRYFTEFGSFGAIASKWLKFDHIVCDLECSLKNLFSFFGNIYDLW